MFEIYLDRYLPRDCIWCNKQLKIFVNKVIQMFLKMSRSKDSAFFSHPLASEAATSASSGEAQNVVVPPTAIEPQDTASMPGTLLLTTVNRRVEFHINDPTFGRAVGTTTFPQTFFFPKIGPRA
jgi:hypothetical protein